jgi:hypothetical protein
LVNLLKSDFGINILLTKRFFLMKIEFDINDELVQNINPNGREELARRCKVLAEEILDEASRIEASRNQSTSSEITASIIGEAAFFSKHAPPKSKKTFIFKLVQFSSTILCIYAGNLMDAEKLKNGATSLWLFLGVISASIFSTAYLIFKDE